MELVAAIEKKFGITIPDAVAAQMITPAIMITYVQEAVVRKANELNEKPSLTHEEISEAVRQVIREQFCIETFHDTDEFVRDLGID